ncbi:MAG: sodium-dependent bicarbonate transport family permease [Candidatus Methylacidiphilales bacterium]|nr:sodium-dependent bicarbonate transport family permease [Candidatus Methylacidiphilales bacterium]
MSALDPVICFFLLGLVGGLAKSDLDIPDQINNAISIYLLLAIGIKGGIALHGATLAPIALPALGTLGLGLLIPVLAYTILRKLGKFSGIDSAAIAAHYGSTSVITFAVALNILSRQGITHEPFMVVLLVILEIPAIIVGLMLARLTHASTNVHWSETLREVVLGKSVLLLVGGLLVAWFNGPERMTDINKLFIEPFKGVLALFMVGMGVAAAKRLGDLRTAGPFLVAFALVMPPLASLLGIGTGMACGLSYGGCVLLGVLAASASYIAATAAVRVALPEANPGYYLVASLGITFPFNVIIGIPLYLRFASWMGA